MRVLRYFFRPACTFALVLMVLFSSVSVLYAQEGLRLGVHPYLSAMELIRRFTPLADYLGRELGLPVSVSISKDYAEHIDAIGEGWLDLAYMGPASYVRLVDVHGRHPVLARLEINGSPAFRGVVVTDRDSSIRDLADMEGKRFAFGDPNSTMSYLVPRFMLLEAGVRLSDLSGYEHLSNHDNVALGVLVGSFDAGAVKEEVFQKYEKRGLKALAHTPEISEHVFVARKLLRKETVQALREAMLRLKTRENGKAVMNSIKTGTTGLVPARDGDYDNLRSMMYTLKKRSDRL